MYYCCSGRLPGAGGLGLLEGLKAGRRLMGSKVHSASASFGKSHVCSCWP